MGPHNDPHSKLIHRIVSRAGIPSARERRDLERELNAHFEDAAEAARTEDPGSPVLDRFGDPDEIALQLKHLHRVDRIANFALDAFVLMLVSMIAVAALIATLQVAAAFSLGLDPATPRRLPQQITSIATLVLGYMGTYLASRGFERRRILKITALYGALCLAVSAVRLFLPHFDPIAPLLTLAIGVVVRMLQETGLRRLWVFASVVPVMAAGLFSSRAISAGTELPLWGAAMIRGAGLTVACYLLTRLSRNHQARRLA